MVIYTVHIKGKLEFYICYLIFLIVHSALFIFRKFILEFKKTLSICFTIFSTNGSRYLRMDQVKFVEVSPSKI